MGFAWWSDEEEEIDKEGWVDMIQSLTVWGMLYIQKVAIWPEHPHQWQPESFVTSHQWSPRLSTGPGFRIRSRVARMTSSGSSTLTAILAAADDVRMEVMVWRLGSVAWARREVRIEWREEWRCMSRMSLNSVSSILQPKASNFWRAAKRDWT
jgi:hypothetical protein